MIIACGTRGIYYSIQVRSSTMFLAQKPVVFGSKVCFYNVFVCSITVVTLFINTGWPHSAMRLKSRGALYGLITFSETFSPQNYLSDGWSVNLFSAYYPLIISGFSIIICFWAEVSTAQYFTMVLIINLLIANLSDHSHFYLITTFWGLHMIKKGGGIGKEVVQY